MHAWISNQVKELKDKIEQNDETIKRLHIENTEIRQVIDELGSIK